MKIQCEKTTEIKEGIELDLQPCPFCGLEFLRLFINDTFHQIFCRQCAAKGPLSGSIKQCVKDWNTRK